MLLIYAGLSTPTFVYRTRCFSANQKCIADKIRDVDSSIENCIIYIYAYLRNAYICA